MPPEKSKENTQKTIAASEELRDLSQDTMEEIPKHPQEEEVQSEPQPVPVQPANPAPAQPAPEAAPEKISAILPFLKNELKQMNDRLILNDSDSEELKKVKTELGKLTELINTKDAEPDNAPKNDSLTDAFAPAFRAIETYRHTQANSEDPDISRLENLNRLRPVYAALQRAENDNTVPSEKDLQTASLINDAALFYLKKMGEGYVKAGLTNNDVLDEVKAALDEDDNAVRWYDVRSNDILERLAYKDPARLKSFLDDKYIVPVENPDAVKLFSDSEMTALNLLYPDPSVSYAQKHQRFMNSVNDSSIVVTDQSGKPVKPLEALDQLITNTLDKDCKVHCYRHEEGRFVGKSIDLNQKSLSNPGTEPLAMDRRLIYRDAAHDVSVLVKELDGASTFFGPTEERRQMSEKLNEMQRRLTAFNQGGSDQGFTAEEIEGYKNAAIGYIEAKQENSSYDSKQIDRLCVAQKMLAICDMLGDPNTTYKQYLTDMNASKLFFDGIAVQAAHADRSNETLRNALIQNLTSPDGSLENNGSVRSRAEVRQLIKDNATFKTATEHLSLTELRTALDESREETYGKYDLGNRFWQKIQKDAGVGPYGHKGPYGEPDTNPETPLYEAYNNFLLGMAKSLTNDPSVQELQSLNSETREQAAKFIQTEIRKGSIFYDDGTPLTPGTDIASVYKKLRPDKKNENSPSHLHIRKNKQVIQVEVNHNGMVVENGQQKFTEVAAVRPYLRNRVNELTSDLLSTQHFWVNSSPEYKNASESLVELSKKLERLDLGNQRNELGHPYGFKDLEKEFLPVVKAMSQYMDDKKGEQQLDARQATRLKVMSRFMTLYDTVKAAAESPDEYCSLQDIRYAEVKNKIALANLDNMGPEFLKAGLTNLDLQRQVRASVPAPDPNSPETYKLRDRDIAAGYLYKDMENVKTSLDNNFSIREKAPAAEVQAPFREEFTEEEARVLGALYGGGSANRAGKYQHLWKDVKSGNIVVQDGNGRTVDADSALSTLMENLGKGEGNTHCYKLSIDHTTYKGVRLHTDLDPAKTDDVINALYPDEADRAAKYAKFDDEITSGKIKLLDENGAEIDPVKWWNEKVKPIHDKSGDPEPANEEKKKTYFRLASGILTDIVSSRMDPKYPHVSREGQNVRLEVHRTSSLVMDLSGHDLPANELHKLGESSRDAFTPEEEKILNSIPGYQGTAREKHQRFWEDVKTGKIMVLDKFGKMAEPDDALRTLAANVTGPEDRPSMLMRRTVTEKVRDEDKVKVVYNGVKIAPSAEDGQKLEVRKCEPQIEADRMLIISDVMSETARMIKDLSRADGFLPASKERRVMGDKLKDIFKKFDVYDVIKEGQSGQDAFADAYNELASAARGYIISKRDSRNLDARQVERLCVANRILTVSDLVRDTATNNYKDYLINMYAEKGHLDGIAYAASQKNVNSGYRKELTDMLTNPTAEATKDYATSRNIAARNMQNRMTVAASDEFRKHVRDMSIGDLKKALREPREVTCKALNRLEKVEMKVLTSNVDFKDEKKVKPVVAQ